MVDSATRPTTTPPARGGFAAPSTPTRRTGRARWKDGRLVLGVLLVAITALAGAKLLSSADDTTTVRAAKHVIPVGTTLSGDDLTTVRVRFTSSDDAARYVAADADVDGMVAVRAIGAGELLPKAATAARRDSERTELPLSVETGRLPSDLAVGDRVDVWSTPRDTAGATTGPPTAQKLWAGVQVIDLDTVKGVAGGNGRRQVLVALERGQLAGLPGSLGKLGAGEPLLVRRNH